MPIDRERERRRIQRELGTDRRGPETPVRRTEPLNAPEFDHPGDPYFVNCEECKWRKALHCPDCKIAVTGCACTLTDKAVGELDRMRREQISTKLWTPESRN